jgi:cytochrome c553
VARLASVKADPLAATLLVVLAAAYLGGAVLVVTALGKILRAWWAAWRARTETVSVDDALRAKATTAMSAAAAAAGLAPPTTDAVAILGSPTGTGQPHAVGTGGLAVTRFRRGRPPTVVFTQASLTGLSDAALQNLAAHARSRHPTP